MDMTIETFALLSFIGCLVLGAGCVTLFILWVDEGREAEDLRKSKEELRDSMASYNYYLYEQLRSAKSENEDLRTYIYRQQKEQQKQDN